MLIGNYATSAALIGSFYGKPARASPISAKYRAPVSYTHLTLPTTPYV